MFPIFARPCHLLENQLYVKAEKCEFSSVSFLGFVFSEGPMCMDPEKVKAVAGLAHNRKEVQRFLGFANSSSIASPLHALTSLKVHFTWSPQTEATFSKLKKAFTSAPVLVIPDTSLQFIVEVDDTDAGGGLFCLRGLRKTIRFTGVLSVQETIHRDTELQCG